MGIKLSKWFGVSNQYYLILPCVLQTIVHSDDSIWGGGTWMLKGVRPPSHSLKYDCTLFGSVSGGDFGPPDQ
jgi:hypothetical protein